ncbi:MAG: hypothetical protein LN575_01185 [Rickettsia endosymbiont of Gnoriste bilineata]|nr:hypothetical protein [Rickettsia endosymbiont of Gnoriste bilineata]
MKIMLDFIKPIILLRLITFILLISGIVNMQAYADTVKTNENNHYLLTRDYYNSLITSNSLPIAELGMLVNILPKGGGIKYSFLTEEEKKKQLNLLDKKFILFEEDIALHSSFLTGRLQKYTHLENWNVK